MYFLADKLLSDNRIICVRWSRFPATILVTAIERETMLGTIDVFEDGVDILSQFFLNVEICLSAASWWLVMKRHLWFILTWVSGRNRDQESSVVFVRLLEMRENTVVLCYSNSHMPRWLSEYARTKSFSSITTIVRSIFFFCVKIDTSSQSAAHILRFRISSCPISIPVDRKSTQ